uniref:Putative Naegleria-specific protein n=1 Tax=Naegleria fowleri TaxID=5763 RepID=M1H0Q5_NAEFO|nr:putative Naegleria-specific protein [Naegleria fowleri]
MGQNKSSSSGVVSDSFSEYLEKASLSSREQQQLLDLYNSYASSAPYRDDESDSSEDDQSEYLKDPLEEESEDVDNSSTTLAAFTNPLHFTLSSSTLVNSTKVQRSNTTPVFKSKNAKITFHIDHITVRRRKRRFPLSLSSLSPPNKHHHDESSSPQHENFPNPSTPSPSTIPPNSSPPPSKQWYICEKYCELKKMDGKLGNVFLATQVASEISSNNNNENIDGKSLNFSSRNHSVLHPLHNRPVTVKFLKCSQQEWSGASSTNSQYPLERYLNELKNYWYMTLNSISHGKKSDYFEEKKHDDFFFKIYVDRNFYNSPVSANGHVFIMLVMPYFENSLSSVISQYKRMDRTFSLLEIIQIFKQILRPILQLHQLGYGHHNLKPENVFIIPSHHSTHHHHLSTPRNRPNKSKKQGFMKSNNSNEDYDIILTDPFPRMNVLQRSNMSLMNMSAIRKSVASFNDLLLSDSLHYNSHHHRKSLMSLEPLSPHSTLTPSPSSNSMSPASQPSFSPSNYNTNNPSTFNLTLSLTSTKSLNDFKPFPNRHAFEIKSLSEYLSPEFKSLSCGKKYLTIKQFSENLSTESGCETDTKNNLDLLSTSIIGATDVFALGILFYQIMSLDLSLDALVHASSIHSKRCFIRESIIMNYRQDVEFLDLYERLIDLITYQMLAVHPEERISPKNLFLHLDQMESFIKRRVMVAHWDLDKTALSGNVVGNMNTNCSNYNNGAPKTLLQKSALSSNSLTFNDEEAESIFYKLMVIQYAGVKNALPELMKKLSCISLYSPLRGFQAPYQTTGSDFKKTTSRGETTSISNMMTLASGSEDHGKLALTAALDELDHDDPFSILDHIDLNGFYHPEHNIKSLNQLGFSPEVFAMRGIGSFLGASKFKIEKFLECKRSKEVLLASKRSLKKNPIFKNTQQYRVTCIPIYSSMTLNANPRTLISIGSKLQVPFSEEYSSDVTKCISSHDSVDYYFNGYNIIETILNSYNYSQTLFPVIEKFSWVNMHCIVEPANILNFTPLHQYLALKKDSSSDITIDDLTPSYLSNSSIPLSTTQEQQLYYLDEEECVKLQIHSFVKPLPKPNPTPFTTFQVCNFALQLAESLNYFHQLDVVHCNINTESVLFFDEKLVFTGYDDSQVKGTKLNDYSFVAPEYFFPLQNGQALTIHDKLDIYHFGILLIELILGLELDSSISVLTITQNEERFIRELDFQFELRNVPKRISSLFKTCVCANPKKRLTSKDILYELNEVLKKK